MGRSMFIPVVTKQESELPFYITTIGTTKEEKKVYRPEGIVSWQILYSRKGEGQARIYDDVFRVCERMIMVLPPGTPHDYYMTGECWTTHWITFGGWAAERLFDINAGVWIIPEEFDFLSKFEEILSFKNTPEWSQKSSVLLYSLLLECMDIMAEGIVPLYKLRNQLSDCLKFIEKNYAKTIGLSDLANINGVSEEHLCRIFKLYTGMRPFEYITNLRIQRAKEYLYEYKNIKVNEIAKMTGFQSVSYFCMVFKKNVGVTPAEYRKLYG